MTTELADSHSTRPATEPLALKSNEGLGLAPEGAEWEHLKPYGYAPGNYMNKCHNCEHVVTGLDKRAMTCRPCAEALHEAWSKPPCQECGAMTQQEAETRCKCGGDKDDCHGCKLWPD